MTVAASNAVLIELADRGSPEDPCPTMYVTLPPLGRSLNNGSGKYGRASARSASVWHAFTLRGNPDRYTDARSITTSVSSPWCATSSRDDSAARRRAVT